MDAIELSDAFKDEANSIGYGEASAPAGALTDI